MGFALCGIEIMPKEEIYGIWFLSIHSGTDGWKRPMFGLHYDEGTVIIHFLFLQIEIN